MTQRLHRTNLNLYTDDVEWLQKTYGYGWTEQAREIIHRHLHEKRLIESDNPLEYHDVEEPIPIELPKAAACSKCNGSGMLRYQGSGPAEQCKYCEGRGF
jgi:hypothetical protein